MPLPCVPLRKKKKPNSYAHETPSIKRYSLISEMLKCGEGEGTLVNKIQHINKLTEF